MAYGKKITDITLELNKVRRSFKTNLPLVAISIPYKPQIVYPPGAIALFMILYFFVVVVALLRLSNLQNERIV